MFDQKKENINSQNTDSDKKEELIDDKSVTIHTMQDDLNALSGIFPEKYQTPQTEVRRPEASFGNREKAKEGQYFNPFLDKQTPEKQEKIADFASKNNVSSENTDAEEKSENSDEEAKSNSSLSKTIWFFVFFLVIVAFSFGGYYFWSARKVPAPIVKEEKPALDPILEDPIKAEPVPKYLTDKPNFLPIDAENPSYDNLKEVISKTAFEIKNAGIDKSVEFIVTDGKNNPIDFPIWSAISQIKFSDQLMKVLSGKFSLFIYNDGNSPQLGLAIETIDQAKAALLLKKEESDLPLKLKSLFLDGIVLPKNKVIFKDNNYKGVDIRYFNINDNQFTTIDYAFTKNQLIIGTSKNTTWILIDKVLNGE